MTKKKTEIDKPSLPVVAEEKGGLPSEMTMDAGTEIMKSEGQGEIQAAVVLAKRFPRDEERAKASILAACDLENFAGGGYYSFPRGKKKNENGEWVSNIISGGGIRLAREMKRNWSNIRSGFFITHDDDDARGIVAWAWDLEKNNRESASDFFKKLIQRKTAEGNTTWITANERELRELTFRRAAIIERNCLFSLFPSYFIDQCVETCKRTEAGGDKVDLKDKIAKMEKHFAQIGVTKEALERYLKKPVTACTREDVAELRGIAEGIKDGMISKEEREEMFGLPRQMTETERNLQEGVFGNGEKHESLSMDKVRSAESQAAPPEEKPAPKREEKKQEKKEIKGKAAVKSTNSKGAEPEPEKFDPKETALALIRNATKQNWTAVKETVLGMAKEIKGSQNLLDITSAINNRQREMLK